MNLTSTLQSDVAAFDFPINVNGNDIAVTALCIVAKKYALKIQAHTDHIVKGGFWVTACKLCAQNYRT